MFLALRISEQSRKQGNVIDARSEHPGDYRMAGFVVRDQGLAGHRAKDGPSGALEYLDVPCRASVAALKETVPRRFETPFSS